MIQLSNRRDKRGRVLERVADPRFTDLELHAIRRQTITGLTIDSNSRFRRRIDDQYVPPDVVHAKGTQAKTAQRVQGLIRYLKEVRQVFGVRQAVCSPQQSCVELVRVRFATLLR